MTLQQLHEQVSRRRKALAMEESLTRQVWDLEERTRTLDAVRAREQEDVDRLESGSLTALFYSMVGKKEEKLDKERREAYAAAAKYEQAQRELAAAQAQLDQVRAELETLRDCEARYARALADRTAELREKDPVLGPEIAELESQLAWLAAQQQELKEASAAGHSALSTARSMAQSLQSAENWGLWDMFGGGGIITQVAKHSHLDDAQDQVEQLQAQLRRFKTELADVNVQADTQIQVDGFLRFADWFFDGLFVDWTVQNRIYDAQNNLDRTICQIERTLDQLEVIARQLDGKGAQCKEALDRLVLSSEARNALPAGDV